MTEGSLIKKITSGDDKAFRALYELYFHKTFNYAVKIIKSQEDALEITQDVFLKIWDKRGSLDPQQSLSGLIFRITKFLSIDRLRKQRNKIKFLNIVSTEDIGEHSIEQEIFGAELFDRYNEILAKLPPKRRLIFQLSRDNNLSYNEIARELHISPRTVEAQIRLALQQIRSEISNYSDSLLTAVLLGYFAF